MKVIFLDIDGVLNKFEQYMAPSLPTHTWDPSLMQKCGIPLEITETHIRKLNKLIEKTEAKVVITSSWRKGDNDWWNSLLLAFDEAGIWPNSIIDKTPDLRLNRGDEVQDWLDNHPEVLGFVILDDIDEFHDYGLHQHLVQTDFQLGLTDKDIEKAEEILGL